MHWRMQAYRGLTILTTSLATGVRPALDNTFTQPG